MNIRTVRFLRHAESVANVGEPTNDPASIPLTPAGRIAAQEAAFEYDGQPPDLIIVSPFLRAKETAQPFRDRFPQVPVEMWPVEEFTYLDPTRFANTTAAQRRLAVEAFWQKSKAWEANDNAESLFDFLERVRRVLSLLDARKGAHFLVVTHEQFIQAARWMVECSPNLNSTGIVGQFFDYRSANPIPNLEGWVLNLEDERLATAINTRPSLGEAKREQFVSAHEGPAPDNSRRGLERLIRDSQSYRGGDQIRELFKFLGRITNYSPYNAMLLHVQRPDARLVLSASEWERLGRSPKADAHPLVILAFRGPVVFVFEEKDTEGQPLPTVPSFGNLFRNAYAAQGSIPDRMWNRLLESCKKISIEVVERPQRLWKAGRIRCRRGGFEIELNQNHAPAVRFVTLCHELAHLFCGHLGPVNGICKDRDWVSKSVQEIEAESVAYLTALRMGIDSHSHRYLSTYMDYGQSPAFNLDAILVAAGQIEGMCDGSFRVRQG